MPELRLDPLSGLRVIVAAERGARPGAFIDAAAGTVVDPGDRPVPGGPRGPTPAEVYALRPDGGAPDAPGWRVRVVPNKFPALAEGDGAVEDPLERAAASRSCSPLARRPGRTRW